jgi:hypothetical protein
VKRRGAIATSSTTWSKLRGSRRAEERFQFRKRELDRIEVRTRASALVFPPLVIPLADCCAGEASRLRTRVHTRVLLPLPTLSSSTLERPQRELSEIDGSLF